MALCKFFPVLLFLTLTNLLNHHTILSFSSEEDLTHLCLDSGNYTTNDPYDKNLRDLLIYLTSEAPTNGFAMASKGQGKTRTHGLASCRGDLSPHDCWSCIVRASGDMLKLCPNKKAATMLSENCTIRYSNEDFFGQGQTVTNTSSSWFCWRTVSSNKTMTKNATAFGRMVQEFLTQLCEEAALQTRMYASGMSEHDEFQTLYGLAQCSRDLSTIDCTKCLNESVSYVELPECGKEREGVRVYSESCRVRYEVYPFLNDHSHYPIPSPIPSSVPHDGVSPNPAPISSTHKGFEASTFIGLSSSVLLFAITMVW
ncbi:hypothetical protein PIB30_065040 [Stylosanthes scabra]|uniref:Gnk2-homologous domain-containing protein n=1 Tax=Stylosanthes scabra TaxID=79078 RepID=A0ABU6SMW8_9FABA|nr:hypothetical protein [Stylosanthes scabra]